MPENASQAVLGGMLSKLCGDATRVWHGGNFTAGKRAVAAALGGVVPPAGGNLDAIVVAGRDIEEWCYFTGKHLPRLVRGATVVAVLPPAAVEAEVDAGAAALELTPLPDRVACADWWLGAFRRS